MRVPLRSVHNPVFIPGLGQLVTSQGPMSSTINSNDVAPEAVNPTYSCNWLENLFDPSGCASAATATPAPPNLQTLGASAGAAPVTFSTGGPLLGANGQPMNAVVAGTDSNGQPIYANTPTAQQQQTINVAAIQAQATQNAPVDCTQLWNQLTSAACPCTYCQNFGTWIGIGIAALIGLVILEKAL
jgi:hypothetical protein